MKYFLSLALLFCGTMLSFCDSQPANISLEPKVFAEKLSGENVFLLDVRTPEEYNEGHLKGATLINYYDNNFSEEVSKLDKNKTVYVYCRSGKRSSEAQKKMLKKGFYSVINLDGGIIAWQKAELPVEK